MSYSNMASKSFVSISPLRISLISGFKLVGIIICLMLIACGGSGQGDTGTVDADASSSDEETQEVIRIGNGVGTGFEEGIIGADETEIFAGQSTVLRLSIVDEEFLPLSRVVSITSPCISDNLANSTVISGVTQDDGILEFTYTANGCTGVDTIVASTDGFVDDSGSTSQISASIPITITAVDVIGLEYVSAEPSQLTLPGSGGNESSEVTFQVVGEFGGPVFGETVSFALTTDVGGIQLAEESDVDVSDSDGLVSTTILAGNVPISFGVTATHDNTGLIAVSGDLSISTGVAVDGRIIIAADDPSPELADSAINIATVFTFNANDIAGNYVPDNTRVSFVSPEYGSIQSSCLIENGSCSATWLSGGGGFSANRQVTILAYTDGAESFIDNNGNNVFDAEDTFDPALHDKPEIYADTNENGVYDVGEFFVDDDRDGVRDLGDGIWNGPCLAASNPVALCPGRETITIGRSYTIELPTNSATISNSGTFPDDGTTINLATGINNFSGMIVSDGFGNTLPGGSSFSFDLVGEDPVPTLDADGLTIEDISLGPQGTLRATITVDDTSDGTNSGILSLEVTFGGTSSTDLVASWPLVY